MPNEPHALERKQNTSPSSSVCGRDETFHVKTQWMFIGAALRWIDSFDR